MLKYVLAFGIGVMLFLFMKIKPNEKEGQLYRIEYVIINLLIIFFQEIIDVLTKGQYSVLEQNLIALGKAVGLLVIIKIVISVFDIASSRFQKQMTDIDTTENIKWREKTFGILLLLNSINNFILEFFYRNTAFASQAIINLTIFIGFFVPLKWVVGRTILPSRDFFKKIMLQIGEEWIRQEKCVIASGIVFFIVSDYVLLQGKGVWFALRMFSAFVGGFFMGVILSFVFKKNKKKFKMCSEKYIKKKAEQYKEVALEVHDVIRQAKLSEDESGYELAKAWILNNEEKSILKLILMGSCELILYLRGWVPLIVVFVLGILTDKVSSDFISIKQFWIVSIIIIAVGILIDYAFGHLGEWLDGYYIRILKNMSYKQYKYLIADCENDEANS